MSNIQIIHFTIRLFQKPIPPSVRPDYRIEAQWAVSGFEQNWTQKKFGILEIMCKYLPIKQQTIIN